MGTDLGWENKLSLRTAEPQPNGGEVGKGEIYTTKYTKYTKKDTFFDPKCPAAFATMMPVRPGLSPFSRFAYFVYFVVKIPNLVNHGDWTGLK